MRRQVFAFSVLLICFYLSCSSPVESIIQDELHCLIVDVENGLAQIVWREDTAVAIDFGEEEYSSRWAQAYEKAGNPYLKWICISHTDEDHVGGLRSLPNTLSFSGIVYVGAMVDTVLLRSHVSCLDRAVRFRRLTRGAIVDGPSGVQFTCLWPPSKRLEDERGTSTATNRYSSCFRVDFKSTSFLITSDIDSSSMRLIASDQRYNLDVDWMVVPHHGSGGSLQQQFYGFASPRRVVISCGAQNAYNHPAPDVKRFIVTHLKVPLDLTSLSGDIC
ncbi:MAG: ComEC/Rec2 family competence protein, partial [Chitinispirillaceae bacterium]